MITIKNTGGGEIQLGIGKGIVIPAGSQVDIPVDDWKNVLAMSPVAVKLFRDGILVEAPYVEPVVEDEPQVQAPAKKASNKAS